MGKAGNTVSVRLPDGLPQRIRAATGRPLSEIVREFCIAYDKRLVLERDGKEQSDAQD